MNLFVIHQILPDCPWGLNRRRRRRVPPARRSRSTMWNRPWVSWTCHLGRRPWSRPLRPTTPNSCRVTPNRAALELSESRLLQSLVYQQKSSIRFQITRNLLGHCVDAFRISIGVGRSEPLTCVSSVQFKSTNYKWNQLTLENLPFFFYLTLL